MEHWLTVYIYGERLARKYSIPYSRLDLIREVIEINLHDPDMPLSYFVPPKGVAKIGNIIGIDIKAQPYEDYFIEAFSLDNDASK